MTLPTDVVITAAVGVAGFLAGQTWDFAKVRYKEKRLKKALQQEIAEAAPWIRRNIKTLECMIQLSCLDELSNHGPSRIPVVVHAEHFPDINLKLSAAERASFTAIYNKLYNLNQTIGQIYELCLRCGGSPDEFENLRHALDITYRNSHHALLLIGIHLANLKNLEAATDSDKTDRFFHEMEDENDRTLMRLAAEARKDGADAIRKKCKDGAASPVDVRPTPPPEVGKFYFDAEGEKYKCLQVNGGWLRLAQLESQLGQITVDAIVIKPLASVRHLYEITDSDETARLERRYQELISRERKPT